MTFRERLKQLSNVALGYYYRAYNSYGRMALMTPGWQECFDVGIVDSNGTALFSRWPDEDELEKETLSRVYGVAL